ncbi:MAG: hypothetical protein NTU60_05830 [Candidatus Aminicenantes bacterium]|nr:hypothetical protein [Candidatus Aminicenantes bacterium]
MQPIDLLRYVVQCLEKAGIPYFITGAVAGIAYGEPRLTNDIDIVADIQDGHVAELRKCFPEGEYYFDSDSALQAIRRKSQFNIIHPSSGLKIDMMIPTKQPFDKSRFGRVRRMKTDPANEANFASPEDVVLNKMEYYRKRRSEKHLRDILGILKVSADLIDFDYLARWARDLGLDEIWAVVQNRSKK